MAIIKKCEISMITKEKKIWFHFFFFANFKLQYPLGVCLLFIFFFTHRLSFLPFLSFSFPTYYNYNYLLIKCDRLPYLHCLCLYTKQTHTIENNCLAIACYLSFNFIFAVIAFKWSVCLCRLCVLVCIIMMSSANSKRDREIML